MTLANVEFGDLIFHSLFIGIPTALRDAEHLFDRGGLGVSVLIFLLLLKGCENLPLAVGFLGTPGRMASPIQWI